MTGSKYNEPTTSIHVRVPSSLAREVKLLLLNPRNGKVKYGEMNRLVIRLLNDWLEERKKEGPEDEHS